MSNKQLSEWVTRVSKEKLPAFAHTARSLASVSRDHDSSANDLANVILRDSAMTARVLRLANSVHYNPSGKAIETVSYATVRLGFEQVRNLALTVAMIDTVLTAGPQQKVQNEMICAYHAAVQAQRLVKSLDPENIEAVYIGALLHRLGPIMFWCFPFDCDEKLTNAYRDIEDSKEAEISVLGFTLDMLTNALVLEWRLSDILGKSFLADNSPADEEQAVHLGLGIATKVVDGWQSKTMLSEIEQAAKYLDVGVKEARLHVYDSARIASEGLESFGFPRTQSILPPEKNSKTGIASQQKKSKQQQSLSEPDDLAFELRFLRQFTQMLSERMDLNRVLMAVLEGIYRAQKMDQVVFALVDYKLKRLKAKQMIGARQEIIIEMSNNDNDKSGGSGKYLAGLLREAEPSWCKPDEMARLSKEALDPLIVQLDANEFFLNPVLLRNKVIGFVYADRQSSKEALDERSFQSFCHFSGHATLAFNLLSNQ